MNAEVLYGYMVGVLVGLFCAGRMFKDSIRELRAIRDTGEKS